MASAVLFAFPGERFAGVSVAADVTIVDFLRLCFSSARYAVVHLLLGALLGHRRAVGETVPVGVDHFLNLLTQLSPRHVSNQA